MVLLRSIVVGTLISASIELFVCFTGVSAQNLLSENIDPTISGFQVSCQVCPMFLLHKLHVNLRELGCVSLCILCHDLYALTEDGSFTAVYNTVRGKCCCFEYEYHSVESPGKSPLRTDVAQ